VLLGKKDIGMALTTALPPTPAARVAMDTLTNRDFAARRIIEPAAPIQTKLKQAAEHIAGTIVSPYSTFSGTAHPKVLGMTNCELNCWILKLQPPQQSQANEKDWNGQNKKPKPARKNLGG
jgi:hypothetical protein